jgi:tetratricopeptide (TPR) repeat protein
MKTCTGVRAGLVAAIIAVALAAGGRAAAEDAEATYKEGVAAFDAGRYKEAADLFRAAHALKPSFKLLYNIGQSEAAAKRFGAALEAFERYLAEGGDEIAPDRRDEVLAEVERLRKIAAPDGAEVFVDGVRRGIAPLPGKIPLSAGVAHTAKAVLGGESTPERTFTVMGSDTITLELAFPTEEGAPAAAEPAPELESGAAAPAEQGGGSSGLRKGGWALVGIGGAAVIAGVVTGVLAYKKDEKLYDACPNDVCPDTSENRDDIDSLEVTSAVTDVLLFAGGAAVVTGAVLLIVDRTRGRETEMPVAVTPVAGPGFGGAALTGRF